MILSLNGLYGSGGNEIAYKLGEILGYKVYNNEPVDKAMADSDVDMLKSTLEYYDESESAFAKNPVSPVSRAVLALQMDTLPISQAEKANVFWEAQSEEIENEAKEGNAIFVGKCSSHILSGREDTLTFFFTASLDSRIRRICEKYSIEDKRKAEKIVNKTDKKRALAFGAYTGKKWDDPRNYDFCINTDSKDLDKITELIVNLVNQGF